MSGLASEGGRAARRHARRTGAAVGPVRELGRLVAFTAAGEPSLVVLGVGVDDAPDQGVRVRTSSLVR